MCHSSENSWQPPGDLQDAGHMIVQLQTLEIRNSEVGAGKQADSAHCLLEGRRDRAHIGTI